MSDTITVEVAYATPEHQLIISVIVNNDATIAEAIQASGLLNQYPELAINTMDVGIFATLYPLDYGLHANDRIEIYRPLSNDPKAMRRQRAEIMAIHSPKKRR